MELKANTLLQDEFTTEQTSQKVVCLEIQEGTICGSLNTVGQAPHKVVVMERRRRRALEL
eukprot:14819188-Heterocapsa_arctica.AAC.1